MFIVQFAYWLVTKTIEKRKNSSQDSNQNGYFHLLFYNHLNLTIQTQRTCEFYYVTNLNIDEDTFINNKLFYD